MKVSSVLLIRPFGRLIMALILIAGALTIVWLVPTVITRETVVGAALPDKIAAVNSARAATASTLIAVAGAMTGLSAIATYSAARTEEDARSKLALSSEQSLVFSRATAQLGESIDVRVGGLLSLEQLAVTDPAIARRTFTLVEVYVRIHAEPVAQTIGKALSWTQPIDVRIALDVLRALRARDSSLPGLDITEADLRGADLGGL